MRVRNRPYLVLGLLGAVVVLAVLWTFLSPGEGWQAEGLQALGQRFADAAWFPWLIFVIVVIAQQLAVPYLLLVALTVILLGALQGFAVAYAATVVGSLPGYLVGTLYGREILERYASPKVERLDRAFAQRGAVGVIVVNLFPVLPHTMINVVAGASRLRWHHFLLGTAAGLFPSTLVIMILTQILLQFERMPTAAEAFWALVVTALLVLAAWWFGRYLWRRLDDAQ